MEQRAAERHVPANRIARMFAHAGDAQSAFEWLERAYLQREGAMMRLGVAWIGLTSMTTRGFTI